MKTIIQLIFLSFIGQTCLAQQPISANTKSVRGTVIDPQKLPLPYVAITIADSAKKNIALLVTDDKGAFKSNALPNEKIWITFSIIGFKSQTVAVQKGAQDTDLQQITLIQDPTLLKEVTVKATSGVSYRLDKKIFQAGKDLVSQSGSATDVLAGVPAVSVSPTGAVSLRGNPSVLILVNGRRSGSTNALDQIPSDQIDRVEVITNPSSRYEAAGGAGIINIVLKKNKISGLNGQLRLVGGVPNETRINPSINFKSNRVNLFSTLGLRLSDYVGAYQTDRNITTNGLANRLNQTQDEQRHDDNLSLYIGADVNLSEKSTVTAAFLKNAVNDHDDTQLYSNYSNQGGADSSLVRTGESKEKRSYNQIEFNFTQNFKNERKKLTVDLQYDFWNSDKNWNLLTQRNFPNPTKLNAIRTSSDGKSKDFSLQSDLMLPVDSIQLLEVGVKVEKRTVTSNFIAEQQKNDQWQVFENIDNKLAYQEMIAGFYAQLGGKIGKIGYQAGLRTELTEIEINDRFGAYLDQKNYARLFPTLNLNYEMGKFGMLQASYSRRIERPSLNMIYPFNELTDLNTRYIGNPGLNPAFSNVMELAYLLRLKSLTINPSIYYQQHKNAIVEYTYKNNEEIFVTMPVNISKEIRSGFELSLSYELQKYLQLSLEANIYRFEQSGTYSDQDFAFIGSTFTTRIGGSVKFPKLGSLQTRYNLIGAKNTAQGTEKAIHNIDLGLSHNFFGEKVTVLADVTNLFALRKYARTTYGTDYSLIQAGSSNAARYRFTLIYRLNLKANQNVRQAKAGNRS